MQLNTQPPEKKFTAIHCTEYSVHSIFYTIQGEGPFAGCPSVFVRLAGCNLQCPLCDTEYTSGRKTWDIETILGKVKDAFGSARARLIVISGGEPFRQPIGNLAKAFLDAGYTVQIETNGSLYQSGPWEFCTIVCSPKTGAINKSLVPYMDAFKYGGGEGTLATDDGLPVRALVHTAAPRLARPPVGHPAWVYLQPVDVQDQAANWLHTQAVVESCLKFGHTLCLQTHKIVDVP
jgi:organic radical activating enzyme